MNAPGPARRDPLGELTANRIDPEARLAVHYALQPVAAVGQSLAPKAPDDSQQSLCSGGPTRWLGTTAVGGALRAGLEAVRLELQLCDAAGAPLASLPLAGRTLSDALAFLRAELERRGQPAAALVLPTHPPDFPRHTIGDGAAFPRDGAAARADLARLFAGTGEVLEAVRPDPAIPVRLWPHHFDLAASWTAGGASVGLGFSPGDEGSQGQPYWYATIDPRPARPPPLVGGGSWRTSGWWGAELPFSRLAPPGERREQLAAFFRSALTAARAG
ncbi:MAG TPA: hypothetical protein VLD85_14870 [Anaeromyxobacteraceae bacterium]|nr:hypothetical protein [Anaeromyxobacteraceae bacterium]